MLRRAIILAIAVLALAPMPASANPFARTWRWAGRHKRFLIMEGAAVGAAGIHAHGLHRCRRVNGVEACDSHYGAAWGFYGFLTGVNVVAMPAIAESCWKGGGGKFCYVLAYGGSAYQGAWGIHEATINRPREVEPQAPAPSLLKLRF